MNPNVKLTDKFPNTHLTKGRDGAIKQGAYWFVQESDHRKNLGNDSCTFDTHALSAFTPNGWGKFNYKYHVNNDGTLANGNTLGSDKP